MNIFSPILNVIDNFLNKITMYKLVLYYLILLLVVALIFSFFGILPYNPLLLLYSIISITILCWITNTIFSWAFNAPTNSESVYITALILALIITPVRTLDYHYLAFFLWASIWAMASKYIFAIGKKHVFNPAAFAVALTALTINQGASWWVGTLVMMPFVFIGGLLITRKIHRFDLVFGFLGAALVTIFTFSFLHGSNVISSLRQVLLNSSLFFFAFVMLTEPLTTPPTKGLRISYGAIVGFLFAPQIHTASIYSTPELALLAGNIYSYLVSPKQKLMLRLKEKIQLSPSIYDFVFATSQKLKFNPGQYLEWTLAHEAADSRGNRRYFTVASAPTEDDIIMGVKFYDAPSSFKKTLIDMQPGEVIVASQLAGDFVMPKDPNKKLVFIAGGIGITPFRSMIKTLLDIQQKRPITLFYSNRTTAEIVYTDIFDTAHEQLGIKTVYTVTNEEPNSTWLGNRGPITPELIMQEVPDYTEREFYLSGPRSMVTAFESTLQTMGVPKGQIKTDYFPGFA